MAETGVTLEVISWVGVVGVVAVVGVVVGVVGVVTVVGVVAVVGVVGVVGVRLGSQTMLPPQELHNTRRPVLDSVHLLERALHLLLEDQYQ